MRLSELLENEEKGKVAIAAEDFEVTGLTADSRRVAEGYLFAAIPGTQQDGRAFIAEAVMEIEDEALQDEINGRVAAWLSRRRG